MEQVNCAKYPKFSVAMCVYDKDNPEWFKVAVNSILNQTVRPAEVVLVVDGPVNEVLEEIIGQYEQDPLFRVVRLPENQGHGNARRASLDNCSNELVALMDADDVSLPDRFEKQLKVFEENSELTIVGGNISEFIDDESNVVGYRIVPQTHEEISVYLKKRCPLNQVTVMFKNSHVNEVGGYIDWYCEEDYYLWLRLFLAGKNFANVPDILCNVRVGKEMYQRRGGLKYYKSEKALQKYMRKNKIIGFGTYLSNVMKRFIVQVLLPNKLRAWVFKKFARKKEKMVKNEKV